MMRIILPIAMIVAAVGVFFGYIDGQYDAVTQLRAESAQYQEALDKSEELQQVRDRLNATYRTFTLDDLDRLFAVLPDSQDHIRLALNIDTIAKQNGVSISTLTLGTGESDTSSQEDEDDNGNDQLLQLESEVIQFSVVGSYASLIGFLQDLEKNLRIVDITEFTFEAADEEGEPSYSLGLRIYWLK